ncbi:MULTISPECIES: TetR/AcrR family transcriptional regulator [Rhizobium]|uniref:TetR/AcrR family transcriptional regulator n=1 Tax=Rhizobium leguminosarum bv. viciae TaxID=387 RepID=A0A8G2MMC0_RHILV|nr:TetR/AcrR family transcriptional regulator [Rhizobium leguminosarum]MBY5320461.1 TetR/AcrR family transcriptional regulator [Rhizobium leguminosarum]MBY5379711.1 TetR/AcrR family transcriptional regulator [Rhizobium leguminosarum]MBY5423720.1 TetR/AcrR family transcriptional regulator [Rhizobium leguminosarum]MCA2431645.1 TetR/AcrR family transcriptional regulator [Rhizobium leguminosarum]NEH41477.1 TetR family transcriptional regulator [Rhizobium leguminosarum]
MQKSDEMSNVNETPARSRGRPRAFDREAALAQATRLFWIKGFEATSIADLTEAMGIGSPSLYAAFGSKEALYAEALRHYRDNNEALVWAGFFSADTAREAVRSFLMDSAAALTGCVADIPRGCMVALSSVGSEGHVELGELVRAARAVTLDRLKARLNQAISEGEIPVSTDVHALARFVQTVQNGMSILARDGATRGELEAVAELAMLGWDTRTGDAERSQG